MNKVRSAMLETYLERGFPELFKSRTLQLFKDIKKGLQKDHYLEMFLEKLLLGRGEKKKFLYEHLNVYEELFFSLYSKASKEKYAPLLLEKYFSHFEHHPKKYRQKIEEVQKALGKKLSDLPQFSDEKKFSELDKKTIFSFVKNLFSK
jgi:hypothetical protein